MFQRRSMSQVPDNPAAFSPQPVTTCPLCGKERPPLSARQLWARGWHRVMWVWTCAECFCQSTPYSLDVTLARALRQTVRH